MCKKNKQENNLIYLQYCLHLYVSCLKRMQSYVIRSMPSITQTLYASFNPYIFTLFSNRYIKILFY